jgi:acetoin utilization deacetylase AcuC-like enzyme
MRRLLRRLRRLLAAARLRVVYDERYGSTIPSVPLDPSRGEHILAFLLDRGLVRRRHVYRPRPAALRNVLRVHTEPYVESLQDRAVVSAICGVDLRDDQAQQLVDVQRLAVGGTIYAMRHALASRRPVVHLGGGFHHAGPGRGLGFCALNDVAIAVRRLQAKGFRRPVLIVDLDLHHGNGTRAVFAQDPTVHTYSIHNTSWDDDPAIATTDVALGGGVTDATYLAAVRDTLPAVLAAHRPGLVVYLAGTDPAADDLLGDWNVTAAGMLARDRFVVDQVHAICGPRTPLVVVLSGGYGHGAWRYSARFLAWLVRGKPVEPPDDMELTLRRYRRAFARLDRALLARRGSEWALTADDLVGGDPGERRETRVLGRYTPQGVELLLERVGVFRRLRLLGFPDPVVVVDFGSGLGHTVRVFGEPERQNLLIEMRLRRDRRLVPDGDVLFVEWMLLQNPRVQFSARLPPLPGQQHPGLGLLGVVVGLLMLICEKVGLEAVVDVPSQYFVAAVGHKHMRFLDPTAQARFEALAETLSGMPLAEAERALAEGRVVDAATGASVAWEPTPMVIPVSERLRETLRGPAYLAAVREARERLALRVEG